MWITLTQFQGFEIVQNRLQVVPIWVPTLSWGICQSPSCLVNLGYKFPQVLFEHHKYWFLNLPVTSSRNDMTPVWERQSPGSGPLPMLSPFPDPCHCPFLSALLFQCSNDFKTLSLCFPGFLFFFFLENWSKWSSLLLLKAEVPSLIIKIEIIMFVRFYL